MIDLGEQPSIEDAKDVFFADLIERGEDCIEGPVWRTAGYDNPGWTEFHDNACCGYEEARATIQGIPFELAATFGH